MKPQEILKLLRKETSEIILFHSLNGKDSIVLLEMTTQIFDVVHCVFMYVVLDMEHMNKYKRYFERAYKNTVWHEIRHHAWYDFKKYGSFGTKQDSSIKRKPLSKIMIETRKTLGLEWVILGQKQSDGLSRRLQLRNYEHEAIDRKNHKVFPLSRWKNKDCYAYIKYKGLLPPQNYGDTRQSTSNNIADGIYLTWVKNNYPVDFKKIITEFPESEIIQWKDENQQK